MNTEPEGVPLGTVIGGKYRLDRLLGRGGFGAVFGATVADGGQAAVKVFSRSVLDQTGGEARFYREAELVRRLSHPNTVRVLDAGADTRGVLYIAFELLVGRSIEAAIAESGPMAPQRAAEIVIDVLDALEEAHRLGVIHRDIKPANLFLARSQLGGERLKVLDFGIAKSTNPNTRAGLTRDGTMIGTPIYMAPEQMLGGNVDARTDLFALGIVLGEMIDGRSPYGEEPSGIAIMTDRVAGKPIPFSSSLLTSTIAPIVLRATAADPAHRFSSASEMRQAIRNLLPSLARAPMYAPPAPHVSSTFSGAPTEVSAAQLFQSSTSHPTAWPPPTPAWPAAPFQSFGPGVAASASRSSSKASVLLAVVGLLVLVLVIGGALGAVLLMRPVSPHPAATDDDDEPSEPTKKKNISDPSPTESADPHRQRPVPIPPTPQTATPPTPVAHVRERACPAVDALGPAALAPHVRAAGLEVTGQLTMCPGDMVNFECVGATGKGVTAKSPNGESIQVYLLASSNHADIDHFLATERTSSEGEETLLVGNSKVVVVGVGEPFASRIAGRICH